MTAVILGTAADTRIADAAMKGDKETVRSLLKQAADVNSSQGDGMTGLHWAALNGDVELAQLLLYAGANVRAATRLGGNTPLMLAAQRGHAPVIDLLLKAGADPKVKGVAGITPLMMAASSGNAEAVELIAKTGVDVNATETERGQTALSFAAAFNRPESIKVLLKHGADPNRKSKWIKPLPRQRGEDQQQMQQQQQPAPQQQAGQRGRGSEPAPAQQTQAQPQAPAQPQQAAAPPAGQRGQRGGGQGAAPAGQAAQNPNAPQPEDPTASGGNPRGEFTPLMYATRQGNFDAVLALVESGNVNLNLWSADGSTALLIATINGNLDIAKYLVEKGADVRIASMDGAAPLFALVNVVWARKTFHPQPTTKFERTPYLELMKLLLDKGADPNARLKKDLWYVEYAFNLESTNFAGATAFWKSAAVGDIEGMRLLASYGADPHIPNTEGVTPLLTASGAGFHGNDEVVTATGRLAAVKFLVEEMKADVNAADVGPPPNPNAQRQGGFGNRVAGGVTALHNAAARGDNAMILYLVSKGARVDAVTKAGATVVDMANGPRQRIQPFAETVALLEMLGAKNSHKCVSC